MSYPVAPKQQASRKGRQFLNQTLHTKSKTRWVTAFMAQNHCLPHPDSLPAGLTVRDVTFLSPFPCKSNSLSSFSIIFPLRAAFMYMLLARLWCFFSPCFDRRALPGTRNSVARRKHFENHRWKRNYNDYQATCRSATNRRRRVNRFCS